MDIRSKEQFLITVRHRLITRSKHNKNLLFGVTGDRRGVQRLKIQHYIWLIYGYTN